MNILNFLQLNSDLTSAPTLSRFFYKNCLEYNDIAMYKILFKLEHIVKYGNIQFEKH